MAGRGSSGSGGFGCVPVVVGVVPNEMPKKCEGIEGHDDDDLHGSVEEHLSMLCCGG